MKVGRRAKQNQAAFPVADGRSSVRDRATIARALLAIEITNAKTLSCKRL